MQVGLFDKEFAHLKNYCGYDQSKKLEWIKDEDRDVSVFTERCYDLVKKSKAKIKIAWPLEPYCIHPYAYENLKSGMHCDFDYVLTFDNKFACWLKQNSKAEPIWWTPGGSWIWRRDWKIYPKTKNISIVASTKDWTEGHRLRQQIIKQFSNKFDLVCGYGRNYVVEHKVNIFKDYRYSVVVENSQTDDYWSDKLIDCFACGTIPIFWGTKNIGNYFNKKGMFVFDVLQQLDIILDNFIGDCPEAIYNKIFPMVEDNFKCAQKYNIVEDILYENLFRKFE